MNWIIHVDMNSYFASVEQQVNPRLRGKAIGVGGKPGTRSVIAAASREAKKRGVATAMSSWDAVRICPELIIVEPHYHLYQVYSERLFGILERYSPDLELFSIDEAFLKLTVRNPDPFYALQSVIGVVRSIKADLKRELGVVLTASIGIAPNKRLAKLASESRKPDGLVVLLGDTEQDVVGQLRQEGIEAWTRGELFSETDIEALCGIGPRLGRRLRGAGIRTLADLAARTLDELRTIVYPYERELYLIGRGIDTSPLTPYWQAKHEQSIGHQYTMPRDLPVTALSPILMYLAEKVGNRLRAGGYGSHGIALYLRKLDRSGWSAQKRSSRTLESDTDLFNSAWQLIEEALDDPMSGLTSTTLIRMPSITATHLLRTSHSSSPLCEHDQANLRLAQAVSRIRSRYGSRSVSSGLSASMELHHIPDGRRKRFTPHHGTIHMALQ